MLAFFERLEGDNRRYISETCWRLARFRVSQSDMEGAEPYLRRTIQIDREFWPGGDGRLALPLALLGESQLAQEKYAEAEEVLQESLELREQMDPASPEYPKRFETMQALGAAVLGQGRLAEAEELLLRAVEGLRSQPKISSKHVRDALEQLVRLYETWNRPDQAETWRAQLNEFDAAVQSDGN